MKREDIVTAVEAYLAAWNGCTAKVDTIVRFRSMGESQAIVTVQEGDARWALRVGLFPDEEPPAVVVLDDSLSADAAAVDAFIAGVQ